MGGSGQAKNFKIHPGQQVCPDRPAALMRLHKGNFGTGKEAINLGRSKGITPVLYYCIES
jgi:hypothetical protein